MTISTIFAQADPTGVSGYNTTQESGKNSYSVGFTVTANGNLTKIWYYSPATATTLPDQVSLFTQGNTTPVLHEAASWSGAAGSGWMSTDVTSTPVSPGTTYLAQYSSPTGGLFQAYLFTPSNGWFPTTSTDGRITAPALVTTGVDNGPYQNSVDGYPATAPPGLLNWLVDVSIDFGSAGNTVTVTNPGTQNSTQGNAANLQIVASDSDSGQTLTYSATGLPNGASISTSTGLITGTLTTAGTFTVTVTATDTTSAHGSQTFSWTVTASSNPAITTSSPLPLGVKGISYSQQLASAGGSGTGYTYSVVSGTLPTGLTCSSGGLISGTPTATGVSTVAIQVTDSLSHSATKSFSIEIDLVEVSSISTSGHITTYSTLSNLNNTSNAGPMAMRVLMPDSPSGNAARRFLWVLPVEPATSTTQGVSFGDGLATISALNKQNQYNAVCIMPGFPIDPWFGDHATDPQTKQESYILALVDWAKANLAVTGTEKHYIIGFSKSGFGGQILFLRNQGIFEKVISWDAATDYATLAQYDGGAVFGTQGQLNAYKLYDPNLSTWADAGNLKSVNRIDLSAGEALIGATSDYAARLTADGMLNTYTQVVTDVHNWSTNPGWVGPALDRIFASESIPVDVMVASTII